MDLGSRTAFENQARFKMLTMPLKRPRRSTRSLEDLGTRVDQLAVLLTLLEPEIQEIFESGEVAPPSCWIVRYQARGRKSSYGYYKLHSTEPIFPTSIKGKMSRYKHLGKAGSSAYLDGVMQVVRRAKIEGLQRAINTLKAGIEDLSEEGRKNPPK
ncbi:MAG: hypothetical protein ACRDEA_02440 [Microcystaceae cyanobacterium]